jgi:hypothetical protein
MSIPEEQYDVKIGLKLPADAHESVKKRASTWHSLTGGLESPEEFRVQVLNIRSAKKEDLPKIQKAFEEVKRDLEGESFTIQTPRTRLVGRGVGLAAKSTESGKFQRIMDKFRRALNRAGVKEATLTSDDPHIPVVKPKSEKGVAFTPLSEYDISPKNRVQWQAVPSEHLVMETKPQKEPEDRR